MLRRWDDVTKPYLERGGEVKEPGRPHLGRFGLPGLGEPSAALLSGLVRSAERGWDKSLSVGGTIVWRPDCGKKRM